MSDFLFRERFEPGNENFDVDLSSSSACAGFRQADLSLEEFLFCAGEFVRSYSAVRWSASQR